jgi:hypothetical protein
VPVLGGVPVRRRFVRDHGHQALLGVLLLDQILALFAADRATEEHREVRRQAVDLHRVLRAQQLRTEP